MIIFGVFVLASVVAVSKSSASTIDGPCEKIESYLNMKKCYMQSAVIDSKNFSITSDRDETVGGFHATLNKNLKYLPINLGAKFPNLLALFAGECSIKEVSKINFKGLGKLQHLFLHHNQIEQIDDGTFKHVPAVEEILLSHNKIKKLNGRAFASLHKLRKVDLLVNVCINEFFYDAASNTAKIAEMPGIVSEKCGFTVESNPETCSSEKARLEAHMRTQLELLSSLKLNNERLESETTQIESIHTGVKAQLLLVQRCIQLQSESSLEILSP